MAETIGERAVQAIKQRARKQRRSVKEVSDELGIAPWVRWHWERDREPSAYFLKQMALNGYDVIYILTGEKHEHDDRGTILHSRKG